MTDPKAEFERLLAELRPRLHRYCARMTGSVIDGEDVLQETLVKAIEAFPHTGPLANVEGWLFRIAHNRLIDHYRAQGRAEVVSYDDDPDDADRIASLPAAATAQPEALLERKALAQELEVHVTESWKEAVQYGTLTDGPRLNRDLMFQDVFKEMPEQLRKQREQLRAEQGV